MKTEEHMGFVRKVLGVVATQMTVTFVLAFMASAHKPSGNFFKSPYVLIGALIAYIAGVFTLFCNEKARKTVPQNYILLFIVTAGLSSMIAAFAANLTALSVVTAIMGVCLSTVGLFVAAVYASSRAHMVRALYTGLIIAMIMDLVVLTMMLYTMNFKDKAMVFAISLIMCAVSGIFIIFDLLYIIIPGVADTDDYILAALNLYLDIARLFYYLLQLLGENKS